MKKIICVLFALTAALLSRAQATVEWSSELKRGEDGKGEIVLKGRTSGSPDSIHGTVQWITCEGNECHSPEEWDFALEAAEAKAAPAAPDAKKAAAASEKNARAFEENPESGSGMLALILESILWGLAMLLTPCVFPMVPMTVSFFLKGAKNRRRGKVNAFFYGLFIVLLYTVPICLIIGLTYLFGGSGVTADIFNWLSTHWLPNILFFVVFMTFAASFFGAFEITLPSRWTNGADSNSDRGGLGGVFFMALTLVLVSFSCTGPIVGTVLIKSTQGEFWAPMVAILAFSIAFALPFVILALFPSLLSKLPKSGGWLSSVKVVLGFIEIALGLKFLSVADQTYHWGILDREVYLAIWIVVFALLGFYLLGKIRFRDDTPVEHLNVKRLVLVIADFAFVVYLIPGMWGAPLKALSGYLPPMETMDWTYAPAAVTAQPAGGEEIALPHGLKAFGTIEEGLEAARERGCRVLVDITGHGCVNCREMEARVWSDPQVLSLLKEYVIVALYTDDKTPLPESRWVRAENGKMLKDVGRVNSLVARERFGVSSQPAYVILDSEGRQIKPVRAYDLSIERFIDFLK